MSHKNFNLKCFAKMMYLSLYFYYRNFKMNLVENWRLQYDFRPLFRVFLQNFFSYTWPWFEIFYICPTRLTFFYIFWHSKILMNMLALYIKIFIAAPFKKFFWKPVRISRKITSFHTFCISERPFDHSKIGCSSLKRKFRVNK